MAPVSTQKRNSLTLKKKLEILDFLDKKEMSKSEVAAKYSIPRSTLSTILKHRNKLKNSDIAAMPNRSRTTEAKFPRLEVALLEWLKFVRSKNIPVDGNVFKAKAETFALQMDIENFKSSNGWLTRFRERHNLTFKKLCGESAAADKSASDHWKGTKLEQILKEYDPKDIFNADETALFFKLLPDKSLVFKGDPCSGGKRAKQRITVLLTVNMTGTEKLKPLVIGRYLKPRCFKGIPSLPAHYEANKNSWMTSQIFSQWVKRLDNEMAAKKRNILLIVDNCTAHEDVKGLRAVKLEFLPPNVTPISQPLDQGIIQAVKKKYRRMLLNRVILLLDANKECDINLLSAIHLMVAAWNQVEPSTIVNCFRHAGFCVPGDPIQDVPDEDDSVLTSMVREKFPNVETDFNFSDFAVIDENVNCSVDLDEASIISNALQQHEPQEDSSDDEQPSEKRTTKMAVEALQVLREFYEQHENCEDYLALFTRIEKDVLNKKLLKQKTILDFFKK